jgi:hypothetical protein
MISSLVLLLTLPVNAGYGDVDIDGRPSWSERDLHIWTNAIRVEPEAWEAEYNAGGCSFDNFLPAEQVRLPPLAHDPGLNEAARFHSQNMIDLGFFDHTEPDGTTFGERVSRYYDSAYAGENIAAGYPTGFVAVMQGWMCSDGHRSNIMLDGYQELGTGVIDTHYTQNFGGGDRNWSGPVQMGNHSPDSANHEATFLADWYASDGPVTFQVVVDGEPYDLTLEWGDADQGVYQADVEPDPIECHQYYFTWEEADGSSGAFPEEGSYTYGESCGDANGWMAGHLGVSGGNGDGAGSGGGAVDGLDNEGNPLTAGTPKLTGCSTIATTNRFGLLALFAGLLVIPATRRRD